MTDSKSEFQKNRDILKSCKRIDLIICIIYLFMCAMMLLDSTVRGLGNFGAETLFALLLGVIPSIAVFILGYNGCYKRSIISAGCAAGTAFVTAVISGILTVVLDEHLLLFALPQIAMYNASLTATSIILTAITVLNIGRYNRVSQQPGFPYFNDRFEVQKSDSVQYNIKSEAEVSYEKNTHNKVTRTEANQFIYSNKSSENAVMDEI